MVTTNIVAAGTVAGVGSALPRGAFLIWQMKQKWPGPALESSGRGDLSVQ